MYHNILVKQRVLRLSYYMHYLIVLACIRKSQVSFHVSSCICSGDKAVVPYENTASLMNTYTTDDSRARVMYITRVDTARLLKEKYKLINDQT